MNDRKLIFPLKDRGVLKRLRVFQEVLIDGVIYTARDRVHSVIESSGGNWPFDLNSNAVYYCGPTGSSGEFPLGSCGPTTSSRMDAWAPGMYERGLAATIGKGPRSPEVVKAIKDAGAVYLMAYGGCGALYGSRVVRADIAAYEDYGPQAVYRMQVDKFPAVVAVDSSGNDMFREKR